MIKRKLVLAGVILAKFGKVSLSVAVKILALLAKIFKGAGATKLALGTASFGAYSLVVNWRFALCLLAAVGIHESGHVWAMRRMGLQTRGFYFIPFFGGMAVSESAFPTAYSEGYIAIMGPIWGLFTATASYLLFLTTGNQLFEVAACWIAFFNLINLIPVHPLDGGRIMRALLRSLSGKASIALWLVIFASGIIFCAKQGFWLFVVLGVMGFISEMAEYDEKQTANPYRQEFDALLADVKKFFGLPKNVGFDELTDNIRRLRKNPDWQNDIAKFQDLRRRFREANATLIKMITRWRKKFRLTLNDSLHYIRLAEPSKAIYDDFYKALQYPEKPNQLSIVNDSAIEPTPKELEKFAVLAKEFQVLFAEIHQAVLPLLVKINNEIEHREIAETKLEDNLNGATFSNLPDEEKLFRIGFIMLSIQPFKAVQYDNAQTQMIVSVNRLHWVFDLTMMLIVSDSYCLSTFNDFYLKTRNYEEWRMQNRQSLLVTGVSVILTVTLFLFMNLTGGHEAAYSVVKFFKEF